MRDPTSEPILLYWVDLCDKCSKIWNMLHKLLTISKRRKLNLHPR